MIRSESGPVAFHSDRISKLCYQSIYHRSLAVYALVRIYWPSIVFIATKARESMHDLWLHNRYFGDDLFRPNWVTVLAYRPNDSQLIYFSSKLCRGFHSVMYRALYMRWGCTDGAMGDEV